MADSLTSKPAEHDATPPLLQMRGVTKSFPGVRALDRVDFTLRSGEVHALMGENGAGKSTLIKVLTGVHSADAGRMTLSGDRIAPHSPADAQRLGISTVYQEVNLIPQRSVAENLFLGRQPRRWKLVNWRAIYRNARTALARLDLDVDVTRPLGSCSIAIQQMVAIARALDVSAKVLVLDEPTSSLDDTEVARLFDVMRKLRDAGLGVIFITHFIDQVYEVADRITVLRNGRLVATESASALPKLQLVSKMVGRPIVGDGPQRRPSGATAATKRDRPLLRARGLGRRNAVRDIDIDLHRGEVVGLAGLLGSGRTETVRLLFGLDRPETGSIELDGRRVSITSPRRAIARGIGLLPEDRQAQGLIPELSLRENIVLALQAKSGWLRPLSRVRQMDLAERFIEALDIDTTDAEKPVRELSGGNQQKAILARWLATKPLLLMLDEPTRGIDVGAKAEVEKLIASLAGQGMAILFISSELEEIARDSHRVIVLRDRRKAGELEGDDVTEPNIMRAIAGGGGP